MYLNDLIKQKNISLYNLSKVSNIPYSTLSEIVSGKRDIKKCNSETVYNLATALDTTIEDLLKGDLQYKNKFNLTREQNIFIAKKKWDENIYCGMKMENRAVTFPETKTILNGVNVPNVKLDDIQAIINMRDAWKYMIDTIDEKLDLEYICKINAFIAKDESLSWGNLRTGQVSISGTNYIPNVPETNKTRQDILSILSALKTDTEKALDMFCYICYNQLFWDGNKRTAMLCASKILINSGAGIMNINDNDMFLFNKKLLEMYDTGEKENLKNFIYNNAITGISFSC